MDNYEVENLPRWLKATTDCLCCRQDMKLYCVREIDEAVQGWYVCNNKECEFPKRFHKKAVQGINYTGGFPEAYKEHLRKKKEEAAKKPEDREVAIATEAKDQDKT